MKIIVVCEIASIHSVKWINQFKHCDIECHIFQAIVPGGNINTLLESGTVYYPGIINQSKIKVINTIVLPEIVIKLLAKIIIFKKAFYYFHINYLIQLIKNLKPDLIISLGLCVNFNNLLLPVYHAKLRMTKTDFPNWIYSSWGSDLDYYPKISNAKKREVEKVISECDYLITECNRDRELAYGFGFKGKYLGKLPAFGGVDLGGLRQFISNDKSSERKIILIKGRDNTNGGDPVGRAMIIMNALPYLIEELKDYDIYIFQASPCIRKIANKLKTNYNLRITLLKYVPYNELMKIFSRSKVYISLTINDGLPSALVEAMTFGVFPIISDLAPFREWITEGLNGSLIENNDLYRLIKSIKKTLEDDHLIDNAAEINKEIICNKLEYNLIRNKYLEIMQMLNENGGIKVVCN